MGRAALVGAVDGLVFLGVLGSLVGLWVARSGESEAAGAWPLVVTGEHDVAATSRMARLIHMSISGSRLEVVAGLRHSLLIEAPQTVSRLLDGFF